MRKTFCDKCGVEIPEYKDCFFVKLHCTVMGEAYQQHWKEKHRNSRALLGDPSELRLELCAGCVKIYPLANLHDRIELAVRKGGDE